MKFKDFKEQIRLMPLEDDAEVVVNSLGDNYNEPVKSVTVRDGDKLSINL